MGVQTILAIPISGPAGNEEENAGWCLLLYRQSRELGSGAIDRAALCGRHMGLAIQVARAAAEVKRSVVASERKRISRELHDTLGQGLTAILLQIEMGKTLLGDGDKNALLALDRAVELVRESLAEARRAIWNMRPRALSESDLPTALEALLRNMAAGSGIATKFTLRGPLPPLTVEMETNLLRIMQEAVTNILRHARARTIRVRLAFDDELVKMSVEDDGCGFSLAEARTGDGFGLISMRESAERLSGRLLISSHAARGTRILAKIPLTES
jgi:signal transduction histidine kinase